MTNIRLYQNRDITLGETLRLDENTSRHVNQVLRKVVGDVVVLFNGTGHEYRSKIIEVTKKHVTVQIVDDFLCKTESPLRVHLYQSVSKGDRMDTAIQKAVEVGVTGITPIISEYTVVRISADTADKKYAHWNKIIESACEQSGRAVLPVLNPLMSYSDAVESLKETQCVVLHPEGKQPLSKVPLENKETNLLIGPEGGLSEYEILLAEKSDFLICRLGNRVLRTETAPIAAISVLQSRLGDY